MSEWNQRDTSETRNRVFAHISTINYQQVKGSTAFCIGVERQVECERRLPIGDTENGMFFLRRAN
jgi:hypothetical protein